MQSDWSRTFSISTQELDFLQPCGFYRLSKVVCCSKPKNGINRDFSSKSALPIYFRALGACLTNPKGIFMIKL